MSFWSKIGALLGKNPIETIADTVDRFVTTKEEKEKLKQELLKIQHEIDMADKVLAAEDRANAREREIEVTKSGKSDAMMIISGVFALLSGVASIIVVLFYDVKDKELFYFVAGAAFSWVTQVISYYFGSSIGSKEKDRFIELAKKE